jgi:ribose 1,5-bisphosphate isomerase
MWLALTLSEVERIASEIKSMKIRGAGEIARSAVQALRLTALKSKAESKDSLLNELEVAANLLLATRPTAVSLPNGIGYVMHKVRGASLTAQNVSELRELVVRSADEFIEASRQAVARIGEIGARRIRNGDILMTHCDSAAAISVIERAWNEGKRIEVYVTETRPRLQGRLTAKKLSEAGIPTTLIVDSAARYFVKDADKVIVGADAVAANGAVVNKIGTSMIALAAHEARVQFLVAAETYKFSAETILGELVTIEERDSEEIIEANEHRKMPRVKVRNPAFDVTPPEYVDLIITERGVIPPQAAILILREMVGILTADEFKGYTGFGALRILGED